MRLLDVKNTIVLQLNNTLFPDYCCSCERIGAILCDSCIDDIESDFGSTTAHIVGCSRVWVCGERVEALKQTIDAYKFIRTRSAARPLAHLLSRRVGVLPADVHIVPIPTIAKHVRRRGYDHTDLIARDMACRGGVYTPVLKRARSEVQLGASRAERFKQAERAFCVQKPLDSGVYLLVDDIITTGATLTAAASVLRAAGATEVWAVALAKQPLEK